MNEKELSTSYEDMNAWPVKTGLPASLEDEFQQCQTTIVELYTQADQAAIRNQSRHKIIAVLAALLGTGAVLLAIAQLSGLFPRAWPLWGEAIAATLAAVAVLLGIFISFSRAWLLERHKAERCRLLKYGLLTDPKFWSDDETTVAARVKQFQQDVATLQSLSHDDLKAWSENDSIPSVPAAASGGRTESEAFREFVTFYLDERLGKQKEFFSKRMEESAQLNRFTWLFPPLLFWLSVVCALSHFVYDIWWADHQAVSSHEHAPFSVILIALAAALPVIGAGIRTFRTAYEPARNSIRYRAKQVAAEHLHERLRSESSPAERFQDLWCSEQILESEHREWLRLMIEAEWFG